MQNIELARIKPHKEYAKYVSTLDQIAYQLLDPNILTVHAIPLLLQTSPIIAVTAGGNKHYRYISGHRTYTLACLLLNPGTKVPVAIIDRKKIKKHRINQYIMMDLFILPITHTYKFKSNFGVILEQAVKLEKHIFASLFNAKSQHQFAAALGCAKNTIFRPNGSKK
ncbi:hypothetical protein [Vibrio sp.]|uniref:hypothetical protein n=1 Tax=Vibrio sp. TaxID=678 RepID=UPI003D0FDE76